MPESRRRARLTKDHATEIGASDQIEVLAKMMADSMTEGICKQFPDMFKMY